MKKVELIAKRELFDNIGFRLSNCITNRVIIVTK